MRFYKIKAMLWRDFVTLFQTKQRLVEYLLYPITTTLIWGLFGNYFAEFQAGTAMMLLLTNVFWTFSYQSQSAANLQINKDVWSRSLNQLLVSGIDEVEYVVSRLIYSAIVSVFVLGLMLWLVSIFGFTVSSIPQFALIVATTLVASTALSIFIFAFFILLGREYAFISWTFLQLVILLSAPFFPVEIYPKPMQYVSNLLPHTWIFKAVKEMAVGNVNYATISIGFGISVVLLLVSIPFYLWVFRKARKTGKLVRLGF